MAKADVVRRVLGAKDCRGLKNPEAVAELGDELDGEFQIYPGLDQLVASEQREKDRAEGYKPGRIVTRRELRQALRMAAGQ